MNSSRRQQEDIAPVFYGGSVSGLGLRERHLPGLLNGEERGVGWLEILADNILDADEQTLAKLDKLRERFPFSLHSVGTSIGSIDSLNYTYLEKLKALIERLEPFVVSEHLCWSSAHGVHLHDLFPLPMNEETVQHVADRVSEIQETFNREILIENVSSYTTFPESALDEPTFITEIARRSGSGILLDINNIFVNSVNLGIDAKEYVSSVPVDLVKEFHLAGGEEREDYIVDSHSTAVWDEVWELYEHSVDRFGAVPTLIEWDNDIPELSVLCDEAVKANAIISKVEAKKSKADDRCAA